MLAGIIAKIPSQWALYPEILWAVGALLYQLYCALQQKDLLNTRGKRLLAMATLSGIILFCAPIVSLLGQPWWNLLLIIGSILFIYSNLMLSFTTITAQEK